MAADAPPEWARYKRAPGLVLGFHGCDANVAEVVLAGQQAHLKPSENAYDWLGPGVYFWESDPWRALSFASDAQERPFLTRGAILQPTAVGAVIDLGRCCNLLEVAALDEVRQAHQFLAAAAAAAGAPLPRNKGPERGQRFLDKAVMETVHQLRLERQLPDYQTVRAAFLEGEDLYEGAGFKARNHIQIAVRDPGCILGYFRLPGTARP